jgi:hypothetical protein
MEHFYWALPNLSLLHKIGQLKKIISMRGTHKTRVARWFIFKPKILIWVNFGGPLNGKCRNILRTFEIHILRPFGPFCAHLVHFSDFGIMYHEKSAHLA